MTAKAETELWDVYTKDRVKTGTLHRRGEKMQDGEYHMVVHICIFNSRNKDSPLKRAGPTCGMLPWAVRRCRERAARRQRRGKCLRRLV